MNSVFPNQNDDIGTDPTTLQVIDSLEILPTENPNPEVPSQNTDNTVSTPSETVDSIDAIPQAQTNPTEQINAEPKGKKAKTKKKKSMTPNPDKKPHGLLKKIIFAIIIIGLMGGVAFGLYFYLSIANKNRKGFTIKDVKIYAGQTVSNNINDYGTFSKIDISTCLITGLDAVDVNTPGKYKYSVTCQKIKRTATIEVLPPVEIEFATKVLYKAVDNVPMVNEFVTISDNNEYSYFVDEIKLKEYAKSKGGPYGINLSVKHESGKEKLGYAILYVVETAPSMSLSCTNKVTDKTKYEYSVTDYFIFDENRVNLGNTLRMFNYKYKTKEDFDNALLEVDSNRITIDNREGYFIMDTQTQTISIVTKLENETLKKEYDNDFPTQYTSISSYYVNTKNYTCSTPN